jgi:hypothetical protein
MFFVLGSFFKKGFIAQILPQKISPLEFGFDGCFHLYYN